MGKVAKTLGLAAILALLLVGEAMLPAAAVSAWSVPMTAATKVTHT